MPEMPMVRIDLRIHFHKCPPEMCYLEGNSDCDISNIYISKILSAIVVNRVLWNLTETRSIFRLGKGRFKI